MFQAVIPGLAPGLVALVPQLLLLLLAVVFLVLSPRTWWRLVVASARRPLRALVFLGVAVGFVLGIRWLLSLRSVPAPGLVLADNRNGFPIGDRFASRSRAFAPGPRALPAITELPIVATPDDWIEDDLLVRWDATQKRLQCYSLSSGRPQWDDPVFLGDELWATALAKRRTQGKTWEHLVLAVIEEGGASRLNIFDLSTGRLRASAVLPGGATRFVAVVDDKLVTAVGPNVPGPPRIVGWGLSELLASHSAEPEWNVPCSGAILTGIAGDDLGRVYVLSDALQALELRSGHEMASLPVAAQFPGKTALRLAVHHGVVVVLLADAASEPGGGAVLASLELVGKPPAMGWEVLWRLDVPRPLFDEVALAGGRLAWLEDAGGRAALRVDALASGRVVARFDLDGHPTAPLALDAEAAYVALDDGSVLRWPHAGPAPSWQPQLASGGEPAAQAARGLVSTPSGLLVLQDSGLLRLTEAGADEELEGWGHWRGGADLAGAGRTGQDSASIQPDVPEVLWQLDVVAPATPQPGDAVAGVLALEQGFAGLRGQGEQSEVFWLSDDGKLLAAHGASPALRSWAQWKDCVYLAQGAAGAPGRVSALAAEARAQEHALRVLWSRDLGSTWSAAHPIASDGVRLAAATENALVALSSADGEILWSRGDVQGVTALVSTSGRVLAAAGTRAIALRSSDGTSEWETRLPGSDGAVAVSLASYRGRLYVLLLDGQGPERAQPTGGKCRVTCCSTAGGAVVWSCEGEAAPGSSLAVSGDGIVWTTQGVAWVLGLDGKLRTRLRLDERALVPGPFVLATGLAFVADGYSLRAHDVVVDEFLWSRLGAEGSAPRFPACAGALARGLLVVPTRRGFLALGSQR